MDIQQDARSPAPPLGLPTPEPPKSSTVLRNHSLKADDGQRLYNARNEAIQPNEHQSVESAEYESLRRIAPQPENHDFRLKPHSRAKQTGQRNTQQYENVGHRR
jgi:hypothetical protein